MERHREASVFFMWLLNATVPRIAVENPANLSLKNDPRDDAKGYLDALEEYDRLTDFPRGYNPL